MHNSELAYRTTVAEACAYLHQQTGTTWQLADLIAHGLTPYVWLNYDAHYPALFGDANGGYAAPIFFQDDTRRLANGSEDVLITMTKDADNIAIQLAAPGIRAPLDDLRFLRKDLQRLHAQLKKEALPAKPTATISESKQGITREQAVLAFGALVKFNLDSALLRGEAVFGDEGARIKNSKNRKATSSASTTSSQWNPVTLALGLNDAYRVPMSRLRRAFSEHEFLSPWMTQWNQTLALLGE